MRPIKRADHAFPGFYRQYWDWWQRVFWRGRSALELYGGGARGLVDDRNWGGVAIADVPDLWVGVGFTGDGTKASRVAKVELYVDNREANAVWAEFQNGLKHGDARFEPLWSNLNGAVHFNPEARAVHEFGVVAACGTNGWHAAPGTTGCQPEIAVPDAVSIQHCGAAAGRICAHRAKAVDLADAEAVALVGVWMAESIAVFESVAGG